MNRPATNQEACLQLGPARLPPTSAYRVHFRNAFEPLASGVPFLTSKLQRGLLQRVAIIRDGMRSTWGDPRQLCKRGTTIYKRH